MEEFEEESHEETLANIELQRLMGELAKLMDRFIRPLENVSLAKDFSDAINSYTDGLTQYVSSGSVGMANADTSYAYARSVATYARSIVQQKEFEALTQYPEDKERIVSLAKSVIDLASNRTVRHSQRELPHPDEVAGKRILSVGERIQELETLVRALQTVADSSLSRTVEAERALSDLGQRIEIKYDTLVQQADNRFLAHANTIEDQGKNLARAYDDAQDALRRKLRSIDDLMANVGARALSGGYMRAALREERLANKYRTGAFAMMVVVALYVVATVAHSEWFMLETERALTRAMGALFLSFAVGYLIRQSAVHRGQQHKFEQTALDLKAVDPFVSDLSIEARQSVKQQIAEKVFLPKDVATADNGSFGAQELLAKLIDKVEWPKAK